MMQKINIIHSAKYKYLLTTVLLILSFSFFIIFLWYSRVSSNAEKSAITYISSALKNSNDNFEVALKDINQIVSFAASNQENVLSVLSKDQYNSPEEELADNRKMESYILSLYNFKYYISQIMIANLYGKEYSLGATAPYTNITSLPWYSSVVHSNGGKVVIPPHEINDASLDKTVMVLSIAKPIISGNQVLGIVIADIKCDILKDIFSMNMKNNSSILILDNKTGKVVFQQDNKNPMFSVNELDYQGILKGIHASNGSFYTKVRQKNILVVYCSSSFTNWSTITLIPKDDLMSGFDKTRNTTLIVSLIFCAAAVALSFIMSSLLTKNLLKLNKAMKNIDKDNLDISIKIETNDEIGQLYHQFNFMILRIRELISDVKNTEREKRKSEIRELQAQINPHFLYNTLNTIKFLANMQGAENIKKVSESLSTLLHINMSEKSFISVEEEIQYITSYLNIQKYKYSNKFTANISVEDGISRYMVLKLLLQPFVENSLIHGIAPLNIQGILSIRVRKEEDKLKLTIQDNGIGIQEEKIPGILDDRIPSTGIGIRNVVSRIKLHFGEKYGVSILSEPNFFTIAEITVPLITEEEVENYV